MDVMICRRCPEVYKTTKLCCPTCGFIMVGGALDDDGEVALRSAPPPPTLLSPPTPPPRGCPPG